MIITNFTVIVALRNNPKSEKSISLAAASVSASIGTALFFGPVAEPICLNDPVFQGAIWHKLNRVQYLLLGLWRQTAA